MDEAAAEAAQKEKEEAEAALKKELGDIEVKSGDYQIQVRLFDDDHYGRSRHMTHPFVPFALIAGAHH